MSEFNIQERLDAWVKSNDIVDVRFFPKNAAVSSVEDILISAHSAINAVESGECYDFVDKVEESPLTAS